MGVTETDNSVGGGGGTVTSSAAVLLVMPSCVAVMFVVPANTPVARPELSMAATTVSELAHVAVEVMSAAVPSSKSPVAANCCVLPSSMDALAGVTEMDSSAGGGGGPAGVT